MSAQTSQAASSSREVILDLRGVSKDYSSGEGVVRALRDVNLEVREGEFVAIVGTSGSGKSTLMNILGCLDRPTRGTYSLAGVAVGERTNDGRAIVRNRLIGFIFQGFNLLPRTTALENVELPLQYRGFPAKERRKRAMKSLAQVNLADRVHHTPNQLSGGQQQRVAIARALVTDPALLLADEPTGNLDTRTSLEVLALLQRLNRDDGITIVLVTHEQDIAACASRVITFRDGRMVSDVRQDKPADAAAELLELPPPQANGPADFGVESHDPAEIARARVGGPVPFMTYMAMCGGGLLGALIGAAYSFGILGAKVGWIIALASAVGEAFFTTRSGRKRLGKPLTSDQRARIAIWYTFIPWGVLMGLVLVALFAMKTPMPTSLEALSTPGRMLVVAIAVPTALALLRYLMLTLFSFNAASSRAPKNAAS